MIKVYVKKQSNHAFNTPKIKRNLKKFLTNEGIVSDADVSLTIVNEKKMKQLSRMYLGEKESLHNVLSFTYSEVSHKFVDPPDNILHLGEIIVCYPVAIDEAKKEGKLVDDKIWELVKHGAKHLMGHHHD
jgi:probable rRNA maturation factor